MQLVLQHKITEEDLKRIVTNKTHTPLQRRLETFWDKYIDFHSYFPKIDAVKKWEILRDLLKPLKGQQGIKSFLDSNKTYQLQVIDIRNKFAHAKAIEDKGVLKLKGQMEGKDFEFTEAELAMIFFPSKRILQKALNEPRFTQFIQKGVGYICGEDLYEGNRE